MVLSKTKGLSMNLVPTQVDAPSISSTLYHCYKIDSRQKLAKRADVY